MSEGPDGDHGDHGDHGISGDHGLDGAGGIRSTVEAIELRPLEDRATGFSELHEDLRRMLEAEDVLPDA